MKKATLLIIFCVCCILHGESLSIEQLFGSELATELRTDGKIQRSTKTSSTGTFSLLPNTENARNLLSSTDVLQNKYFVESVYIYTKKVSGTNVSDISAVLRRLSSLEGIQYYSNTKKKYRTLYEESYRSSLDGKRLPDPITAGVDEQPFLVYQVDTTLGGNYYYYRYYDYENETAMSSINRDDVSYLFIDVAEKEHMQAFVWTYDTGTEVVVYVVVCAELASLPDFVKKIIDRSFAARADALFEWFKSQVSF